MAVGSSLLASAGGDRVAVLLGLEAAWPAAHAFGPAATAQCAPGDNLALHHAVSTAEPGVVTGLAYTPNGGDILFIESTRMPGKKVLTLTGSLGEVMKESAQTALSLIRSRALDLGIPGDFFETSDIHVHVPQGAIPKDGTSAGITMAVALASLLTGRAVRLGIAMTGEITLRGRVLPIGGVKEKVLAAKRAGIHTVILPAHNASDLEDVPARVRDQLTFLFVETMPEVLVHALAPSGGARPDARDTALH